MRFLDPFPGVPVDSVPGIAVAEIVLDQTQIVSFVRKSEAAGMAQHVGASLRPRPERADYRPAVRPVIPTWPFCTASRSLAHVGEARQAGDATLPHEDQPQQAGLTHCVLDHGPAAAGEGGDGVNM